MKRNKEKARKMRSGKSPYAKARERGEPKQPCQHCQGITRDLKRKAYTE